MRHRLVPVLALSWALAACVDGPVVGPPESVGPGAPFPKADADLDGFPAPEDCLDDGYAWMTTEPYCSEAAPIGFLPADGANAKDFAIVERNGAYHIIHIRGFGSWTLPGNEDDFGHASSVDLINWTTHPNIELLGAPGDWNDKNLWAPQIRQYGLFYLMYYTGVTYGTNPSLNVQRIGRAWSYDLINWNHTIDTCDDVTGQDCVMDCEAPWTNWSSGQPWSGNCRDPFVIFDGARYIMFVSTSLLNGKGVIARAISTDSVEWTLVDYIPFTESGVAESPSILEKDGVFHLFWTKSSGIHHATALDPMGTFTYGGLMVPHGFASEYVPLIQGDGILFPYVDDYRIEFTRFLWDGLVPSLSNIVSPVCLLPASSVYPQNVDPPNGVDDNCDGYIDSVGPPVPPRLGRVKLSVELTPLGDRFP